MNQNTLQILIAMAAYMVIVVGIGIYFSRRSQRNTDNFFLGGRSLGPWITAFSAEASDMSGWLLMGLPGVAYWCGLADAFWTALGLAIGTYLNWLIVARRLRGYSIVAGDSITLPEFFSNRFHEKKKILLTIAAVLILVFFTVYAASCFVACGKLFGALFGLPYHSMMLVGALFVVLYTFLGGFLAESASDFLQGTVMILALVLVLVAGTISAGGIGKVMENARSIAGYLSLGQIAVPEVDANGVQQALNGLPLFGEARNYGALNAVSMLCWGLGYFGMPQVLLRFMAIRKSSELTRSRRIATIWVVISLAAAVFIGILGRALFPAHADLATASSAENVFIKMSQELFPPLLAGVMMAGILAAAMSSSDSYLLIASSAASRNLFGGVFKKDATDKQVMAVSRWVLLLIAVIGIAIAWDENSVIFNVVSFAWAGFGATFGPIMLFSLFWKRVTRSGAIAGMVVGACTVFVWKLLLNPLLGGVFAIYELFPAFVISSLVIFAVSLLSKKPDDAILAEFEKAKAYHKTND